MKSGIFVTGTGTNVGKTLVSALLLSALHSNGLAANYFKPVQTGEDSDSETVQTLTNCRPEHIIPPAYSLAAPLAPIQAAELENMEISIEYLINYWQQLNEGHYIVEGAGGLLVPIAKNFLMRDLIKRLNLPLLIVANTQLGTINHTLLTLEAVQAAKIPIAGLIFSGPLNIRLTKTIKEFTAVPIIAEVPLLDDFQPNSLNKLAYETFFNTDLINP